MVDLSSTLGLARSLAIYYGQPWRRVALRRFYASFIQPGDLVFDIGAHVGSRSRTLASLNAQVVAVEPQPLFADVIAKTLAGRKVTLLRQAVGRSTGNITLHVSRRHPTVTTTRGDWIEAVESSEGFRNVQWDETIEVGMTTLDAMIAEYGAPKFVKIDVEGAEADILAGLTQPLPWIAFEVLPEARSVAIDCLERLATLGTYSFNYVSGERHQFDRETWCDTETMRQRVEQMTTGEGSGDIYARLDNSR